MSKHHSNFMTYVLNSNKSSHFTILFLGRSIVFSNLMHLFIFCLRYGNIQYWIAKCIFYIKSVIYKQLNVLYMYRQQFVNSLFGIFYLYCHFYTLCPFIFLRCSFHQIVFSVIQVYFYSKCSVRLLGLANCHPLFQFW